MTEITRTILFVLGKNVSYSILRGGQGWLVSWLVVLRIYVTLAIFQPYRHLKAGDNQSLKFKWRGGESNPGPLAPQAKSLTTRSPPLPGGQGKREGEDE